jgi:hypothetical protein
VILSDDRRELAAGLSEELIFVSQLFLLALLVGNQAVLHLIDTLYESIVKGLAHVVLAIALRRV